MRDAGQLPHMTALAHAMKLSITLHLCSLASAVKYGRRQALRQWRGIFVGFAVVAFVSSLAVWFLGAVLNRYLRVLAWVGAGYIFWLAWHILQSDGGAEAEAGAQVEASDDQGNPKRRLQ